MHKSKRIAVRESKRSTKGKGTEISDQTFTKTNTSTRTVVDAIILSNLEQEDSDLDSEEIHVSARTEIGKRIPDATIDRKSNPIRWGNSRGLGILDRLDLAIDEMRVMKAESQETKAEIQRLKRMEADVEVMKINTKASEIKAEAMEIDLDVLKLSSDSFLKTRSRFLAVFLRDKVQECTEADYDIIKKGNMIVHRGDPLVDAEVYKHGIRSDDKTYQLLYGMPWRRVLEYANDKDLLRLLEAHATALAESPKPIGESAVLLRREDRHTPLGQLEALFTKFVDLVNQKSYRSNFQQYPTAPVTLAYWQFWKQYDVYKKSLHEIK